MATWRSTAETSVKALRKALKRLHFSAKNLELYMKSPIGDQIRKDGELYCIWKMGVAIILLKHDYIQE